MELKIEEKTTTIKDHLEYKTRDDVVACRLTTAISNLHPLFPRSQRETTTNFFIPLNLFNKLELLELIQSDEKFFYANPTTMKSVVKGATENKWAETQFARYNDSVLDIIEQEDFSPSSLYRCDWKKHILWQWAREIPISIPRRLSYIETQLGEHNYDLDAVEEILKESVGVANVKRITIPYYNASFEGEEALELLLHLPQGIYDDFYRAVGDINNGRPEVCIFQRHLVERYDLFGIKGYLKDDL